MASFSIVSLTLVVLVKPHKVCTKKSQTRNGPACSGELRKKCRGLQVLQSVSGFTTDKESKQLKKAIVVPINF